MLRHYRSIERKKVKAAKRAKRKAKDRALRMRREGLVAALLVGHFAKRVLETLFVHRYSGGMPRSNAAFISFFYSLCVLLIASQQQLVLGGAGHRVQVAGQDGRSVGPARDRVHERQGAPRFFDAAGGAALDGARRLRFQLRV